MGNEFVKPNSKNVLNQELFQEYTNTWLSDVMEASDFMGKEVDYLNKEQFDNVFSAIFKDPDLHFDVFEKSAVLSQVPISMRIDDGQPEGTVDPFIVCSIVALLSKDSVEKKLSYLYQLHFENSFDVDENIKRITDNIISGVLALFKVQKLPSKHLQHGSVLGSLKTMRNSQKLQMKMKEGSIDHEERTSEFTLSDFFQLCQESQVVSKLLNNILQNCAKQQLVQSEHSSKMMESKLVSTELPNVEKKRHPLWNFYIMDMFNESWLTSTPQISYTRSVSSCVELMLYSAKNALPVYDEADTSVFDDVDASLITFDKKKKVMRVSDASKGTDNPKESEGIQSEKYRLMGIIDDFTIMLWFAECCPSSVTEKVKIERKSVVQFKGGRRRSSVVVGNGSETQKRTSTALLSKERDSISRATMLMSMPQLGGRQRRTSFNSAIGSQWRDMGLKFARSSIHEVLKRYTSDTSRKHRSNFSCVLVKEEQLPSSGSSEDRNDVEENKEKKKPRCEVSYTLHDIFQTDQFLYNVVEMVARGYRNVPLAASRSRPYVVSHILTSVDVASFLRLYAKECLGKLAGNTILESGLMKVPQVVSCDLSYGAAIQYLREFNVDTAAIIDSQGRWIGRLDCSSAAMLWWRWRGVALGTPGDQGELDSLRDMFSSERYDEFNVSSVKNFSLFSMMMNPIRECSQIGIEIYDFDNQFKAELERMVEEDSESSDSSTSSSDSGSCTTSTSSDSDSDSEEEDDGVGNLSQISMSTVSKSQAKNDTSKGSEALSALEKERQSKIRRQKQFTNWLRSQGLILEHDTISSALEVMTLFRTTKAFVVNEYGEVVGVVSIRSIAIEILKYENRVQKQNYMLSREEDKEDR